MENNVEEYGQMNFTLPHDVVTLPSAGMFYKNKKDAIKVGYLTASDENILLAGGQDMTLNLLRAKVFEPGMRPEELLEGDVEAILIFLRNTAFGPEMELTLKDPKTDREFKTNVRLDEMNIRRGQKPAEDGTFTVTLPTSKTTVKLKPLNYGETMDLSRQIQSYPQGRVAPRRTLRLQKEIQRVGETTDKGEIAKFVETMPIADSKFISKFMNDNEPRLDMSRVIIAPSGEKLTVNVGFGVEFFRPFF